MAEKMAYYTDQPPTPQQFDLSFAFTTVSTLDKPAILPFLENQRRILKKDSIFLQLQLARPPSTCAQFQEHLHMKERLRHNQRAALLLLRMIILQQKLMDHNQQPPIITDSPEKLLKPDELLML